jgi:hypothetical protein
MSGPRSILSRPRKLQRINELKNWFFENINKIGKPLDIMTKWRRKEPNQ